MISSLLSCFRHMPYGAVTSSVRNKLIWLVGEETRKSKVSRGSPSNPESPRTCIYSPTFQRRWFQSRCFVDLVDGNFSKDYLSALFTCPLINAGIILRRHQEYQSARKNHLLKPATFYRDFRKKIKQQVGYFFFAWTKQYDVTARRNEIQSPRIRPGSCLQLVRTSWIHFHLWDETLRCQNSSMCDTKLIPHVAGDLEHRRERKALWVNGCRFLQPSIYFFAFQSGSRNAVRLIKWRNWRARLVIYFPSNPQPGSYRK